MNQKLLKRRMLRKEKGVMDIDITSLMDIMVILLVFLLKSYNPSDLFVDITKDLDLPASASKELGENSIIVKMDKQKRIFIDQKEIKVKEEMVEALKVKMVELKKYKEMYKKAKVDEKDVFLLNLVMDEGLTYQDFKSIMDMAAVAGFNQYKFIVKGKV